MNDTSKTLEHLRILNTRPLDQGESLNQAISEAGGLSFHLPLLTIEPTPTDWLKDLPNLDHVHQAIFISANAVNYFFKALKHHQLSWPPSIETITIGQKSAEEMVRWDINIHHIPKVAASENLLALPALQHIKNHTILLIKGEEGRTKIATDLTERGAKLIGLEVYRRIFPTTARKDIYSMWHENAIDIILFTSEQAMKNLFVVLSAQDLPRLCKTPCLVISQRLAEAASRLGMQTIIVSRYDKIISSLEDYKKGLRHDSQYKRQNNHSTKK